MRLLTATGVAAVALLSALAAHAQPKKIPIQVLAIVSDDAFEHAQSLTVAMKRAVTRSDGWTLGAGDFSLEVMTAAMNCPEPPDASCLKKIEQKVGTDRFVWGNLKKQGGEVTAHLRLWQRGATKGESRVKYSVNLNDASDEALMTIAEGAFYELVGDEPGIVVVIAGSSNGEVLVDDKPAGTLSDGRAELLLKRGSYKIAVKSPGYEDSVGQVTVKPGGRAELTVQPVPLEGSAAASAAGGDDGPEDRSGGKPSTRKLLGYAGVGVGGAFIVGGFYSMLRVSSIQNDDAFDAYRQGFPRGVEACDAADRGEVSGSVGAATPAEAADQCSTAHTFTTLQWVLFPLGLAAAGAGTYLLVTDDSSKGQSGLFVTPAAGPRGAAIDVRYRF
jgi:hypothetical protein